MFVHDVVRQPKIMDRIAIMHAGRIVETGPAAQIDGTAACHLAGAGS